MTLLGPIGEGLLANGLTAFVSWIWKTAAGGPVSDERRRALRSVAKSAMREAIDQCSRVDAPHDQVQAALRESCNALEHDGVLELLIAGAFIETHLNAHAQLKANWRAEFHAVVTTKARLDLVLMKSVIDVDSLLKQLPALTYLGLSYKATRTKSVLLGWWNHIHHIITLDALRARLDAEHYVPTASAFNSGISIYDMQIEANRALHEILRKREADIETLSLMANQDGYMLVTGDMWAGKSAVMTHLADTLRAQNHDIIQFYVKARYSDNLEHFLDAVIPQLQRLVGTAQRAADRIDDKWQQFSRLWLDATARPDRNRLIMLIDGLDEQRKPGDITAFLPVFISEQTTIILSSRQNPDPLSGLPEHHELLRMTAERRYELKPSPYAAEVRDKAQAALGRYLEDDGITEQDVRRDLIGFLTYSTGPLSADELADLLPGDLSASQVNSMLQPFARNIRRLVDLDGRPRYEFGHNELRVLAEYALGPNGATRYHGRLLAWGDRYASRGWPTDTPWYLIRSYDELVREATDSPDSRRRLVNLCSDDRIRLLRERFPHVQPARDTIAHTIRVISADHTPDLFTIFKLAVRRYELTIYHPYQPNVVATALAATGEIRLGLDVARGIEDQSRHAAALLDIAILLGDQKYADEAYKCAPTVIESNGYSGEVIAALAEYFAASDFDKAASLARRVSVPRWRVESLARIAQRIGSAEVMAEAVDTAWAIDDPFDRVSSLLAIAEIGGQNSLLKAALTVAYSISSDWQRVIALARIAERTFDLSVAEDAIRVAYGLPVNTMYPETSWDRMSALSAVAEGVALLDLQRALEVVREIPESRRAAPLSGIAVKVAEHDPLGALEIARSISIDDLRAAAHATIAVELAPNDLNQALAIARGITYDAAWQSWALAKIAIRSGDVELALEALSISRNVVDQTWLGSALSMISGCLSSSDIEKALAVAHSISNHLHRSMAMAAIATSTSDEQHASKALFEAYRVEDPWQRDQALAAVVRCMIPMNSDRALAIAENISGERSTRSLARAEVARAMMATDAASALVIVRRIEDPVQRAFGLISLSEHGNNGQLVDEGLACVREMEMGDSKVYALARIASYLNRRDIASEAIDLAYRIDDVSSRGWALQFAAVCMAGFDRDKALSAARDSAELYPFRTQALAAVAVRTDDQDLMDEAIRRACSYVHSDSAAAALEAVLEILVLVNHGRAVDVAKVMLQRGLGGRSLPALAALLACSDPTRAIMFAQQPDGGSKFAANPQPLIDIAARWKSCRSDEARHCLAWLADRWQALGDEYGTHWDEMYEYAEPW